MENNFNRKRNLVTVQDMLEKADPKNRKDLGRSPIGNVIFPGSQLGFDIGQIRDFVKVQKRSKGFEFQTVANGTVDFDLDVSGDGVFFLGLNITTEDSATVFNHSYKMMFNEEQLFAKNNGKFLSPETNPNKDLEFFPYPRPMSGNDSIVLSISSKIAEIVYVNAYYI